MEKILFNCLLISCSTHGTEPYEVTQRLVNVMQLTTFDACQVQSSLFALGGGAAGFVFSRLTKQSLAETVATSPAAALCGYLLNLMKFKSPQKTYNLLSHTG